MYPIMSRYVSELPFITYCAICLAVVAFSLDFEVGVLDQFKQILEQDGFALKWAVRE